MVKPGRTRRRCESGIILLGLVSVAPLLSTPVTAQPAPAQRTEAAAPTAPSGTADSPDPEAACSAAAKALAAGDLKPLHSLPANTVSTFTKQQAAGPAFTCMAVADGDTAYCDELPGGAKDACRERVKTLGGLKDKPKESLKAELLYSMCIRERPETECTTLRTAIATRDAAVCAHLPTEDGAWSRKGLCPPIASGDAAKCSVVPAGAPRSMCEALATDDPKRCAKEDKDCAGLVGNLAKMKQSGLGADGVDPVVAAVQQGRKACEPLIKPLSHACTASAPKTHGKESAAKTRDKESAPKTRDKESSPTTPGKESAPTTPGKD